MRHLIDLNSYQPVHMQVLLESNAMNTRQNWSVESLQWKHEKDTSVCPELKQDIYFFSLGYSYPVSTINFLYNILIFQTDQSL